MKAAAMAIDSHVIGRGILNRYFKRTRRSKMLYEKACRFLPGGETRRASFFRPYPVFMAKGEGCFLVDEDENRYVDMQNNYTSLIHGHAHPALRAVSRQHIDTGVVLGSAAACQYRHAAHLADRIPCVESVRYVNSGTEATLFALRAARAFTGRTGFLKMDGGYHGMHEYAQVNIFPEPDYQGPLRPWGEPWVSRRLLADVAVADFNDLNAVETILARRADHIAAVIVEPMFSAGGLFLPQDGYLAGLSALTKRYDVLLILDEVMMFRLAVGGLHTRYGIQPDLVALGKIIGGGFPVGAVGGRRDVMACFSPHHPHPVYHSGTFSGNNITMSAGLKALELYDAQAIERLNALGDRLRRGFADVLRQAGIAAQVTGMGSLAAVHWCSSPLYTARDAADSLRRAGDLPALFHLEMLNNAVFAAPRGMYVLSTPMTQRVVDEVIQAFGATLDRLRPYIVETLPLLAG